jgi:hypothetical protein
MPVKVAPSFFSRTVRGASLGIPSRLPGLLPAKPRVRVPVSGVVNDYVTWIVLGLACLGGTTLALALAIR